jgi:hypothetical protein
MKKTEKAHTLEDNMEKSTARPWHVDNEFYIRDEKHNAIGQLYGSIGGFQVLGNASLIVKAVNNHEALLEACRAAYEEFSKPMDERDYRHGMDILKAAINQASK